MAIDLSPFLLINRQHEGIRSPFIRNDHTLQAKVFHHIESVHSLQNEHPFIYQNMAICPQSRLRLFPIEIKNVEKEKTVRRTCEDTLLNCVIEERS